VNEVVGNTGEGNYIAGLSREVETLLHMSVKQLGIEAGIETKKLFV
jgi:hypothetical protein